MRLPLSDMWHGKHLSEVTADDIREMPTPLILGMLRFHNRHGGATNPALAPQRETLIQEARLRGVRDWALESLDPSPCNICGGAGLYLVGQTTFCSRHRDDAVIALKKMRRAIYEPGASAWEEAGRDRETEMRRRDSAKRRNQLIGRGGGVTK